MLEFMHSESKAPSVWFYNSWPGVLRVRAGFPFPCFPGRGIPLNRYERFNFTQVLQLGMLVTVTRMSKIEGGVRMKAPTLVTVRNNRV